MKVNNLSSYDVESTSGVPQGSPFWAQFYSVYMVVRLNTLHTTTISQFMCMLMIYSVTLDFLTLHQNLLLSYSVFYFRFKVLDECQIFDA